MALKVSRLVPNGRAKAKAFARLQDRLFQLPGVEGVAVQGFAKSRRRPNSEAEVSVFVITSNSPTTALEEKIEETVFAVNLRYGTELEAVHIDWKTLDSSLRHARHAAVQSLPAHQ
jgi:hypothetical protein